MAENTIKVADLAKVRDIEFTKRFTEGIKSLQEILGITRRIRYQTGTVLKAYKTTGKLLEGTGIGEAEEIPISKYKREVAAVAELDYSKWSKETSFEAIKKRGYMEAVRETDDEFLMDIHKGIRKQVFDFVQTGTGKASGKTFQALLSNSWGKLGVAFYDYSQHTPIYLVNNMDVANYMGNTPLTVQDKFGMTYIENFLGLGRVIMSPYIPLGEVFCTASENICLYYDNAAGAEGFEFSTDETGLVGVHHETKYNNLTYKTYAVSAVTLFPEYLDRIMRGVFANPTYDVTVAAETDSIFGVDPANLQTSLAVADGKITGTLHKVTSGTLADTWGPGYFMALKFSGATSGSTVSVGLSPSVSSGIVELDSDMNGVFKVTDKDKQRFKILTEHDGQSVNVQLFDLSSLVLEE